MTRQLWSNPWTPVPLLALLAWSTPLPAAEPEVMHLQAWWGGMTAADIDFVLDQDVNAFHGHLSIHTHGLVHWLTGLDVEAEGTGLATAAGYQPLDFREDSTSHGRERRIDVVFGQPGQPAIKTYDEQRGSDGALLPAEVDGPPPVPDVLRRNVYDPVTALLEIGKRSLDGRPDFTVPVYDGIRRYDLAVQVAGPGHHDIDGKRYDTMDIRVTLHALYGFRSDAFNRWNDASFDVYVGRDAALPLKVETDSFASSTVIGILDLCRRGASCRRVPRS